MFLVYVTFSFRRQTALSESTRIKTYEYSCAQCASSALRRGRWWRWLSSAGRTATSHGEAAEPGGGARHAAARAKARGRARHPHDRRQRPRCRPLRDGREVRRVRGHASYIHNILDTRTSSVHEATRFPLLYTRSRCASTVSVHSRRLEGR